MKIDEPMVKEGDQALMLGRRIRRTAWGYRLSGGGKLVQKLARELSLEVGVGREVKTPAVAGQVRGSLEGDLLIEERPHRYRSQVGKLQYVAMDRPDVQYSTRALARTMTRATAKHVQSLTRIVRYLLRYPEVEYIFEERDKVDEAHCSPVGAESDARSVSGGSLFAGTMVEDTGLDSIVKCGE